MSGVFLPGAGWRLQPLEFVPELLRASNCTRILRRHILVARFLEEGSTMKYFLDSLGWTVFWGVVLTLILYNVVKYALQ
jgi:hypothetical protein